VNAVKIDRSFIANLNEQGDVIVESAIMIARRFGMTVIAEGVETQAQADALAALGVDFMQGYHFARPEKAARLVVVPSDDAVSRPADQAPLPAAQEPFRARSSR
jgi:EAL domain-containing protein (putative c-di-GMP-specific phosphodiesterase class I)